MGNYVNEKIFRSWNDGEQKELSILIYKDGSGELSTPGITIGLSGTYDVRMLKKALHRAKERGLARFFRRDGRELSIWQDIEGGIHVQGVSDYNIYFATPSDLGKFESILEKHIN